MCCFSAVSRLFVSRSDSSAFASSASGVSYLAGRKGNRFLGVRGVTARPHSSDKGIIRDTILSGKKCSLIDQLPFGVLSFQVCIDCISWPEQAKRNRFSIGVLRDYVYDSRSGYCVLLNSIAALGALFRCLAYSLSRVSLSASIVSSAFLMSTTPVARLHVSCVCVCA